MANNEIDATFNLLAKDDGLATSINAGLAGLEQMLNVIGKMNDKLNQASKAMAQLKNAEKVQTKAAPEERAKVQNQKTADTIVKANTIARDQTTSASSGTPASILAGTIARREQNLPVQTGRERTAAALQLSAAKELQTTLQGVDRDAVRADTALRRMTVPLTPATLASYDRLKADIEDIDRRLANAVQRGRFPQAQKLVDQKAEAVAQVKTLPASNRAEIASQNAEARDFAALNKRGIARLEADQIGDAKERDALNKRGIARLESTQAAEVRERDALTKRGIARLEAEQVAAAKEEARLNRAGIQRLESESNAQFRERAAQERAGIKRLEQEQIEDARERARLNRTGIARLDSMALAEARDRAGAVKRGITQADANNLNEAREREALMRRGIARLEAEQLNEARERERLNRTGIARLEADRAAEARIHAADLKRQSDAAQAASRPAVVAKANASRQNVSENLFGDGGASFAGRIAGSYGIFQAVNGMYAALFGTLGLLKDFDSELANLKGIADATDGQMAQLGATILTVGTNTQDGRFGLTELAKASTELAQAGFSTKEIGESLNGFALLAAASGSTLAQSVDVGTAALGSFQLRANEVDHVADVMAGALNLTKLTMDKLGQGLQYVGTTAYESNLTLEQTVALLGGLANSGIRSGSTLGTGLRQFLVDLKDPTTKLQEVMKRLHLSMDDIDVSAHGVTGVMERLSKAGFTASDAYKGLEVRAAASFLALRNQIPLVHDLERAFLLEGAAAKAAAAQMGSLDAQKSLGLNQLGAIAIKATGPAIHGLTELLSVANGVLTIFNALPTGIVAFFGALGTGVVVSIIVKKIRELAAAFAESRTAAVSSAESLKLLVAAQTEAAAAAEGLTVAEYEAANSVEGRAAAAAAAVVATREAAAADVAATEAALALAVAEVATAQAAQTAAVAQSDMALAIARANAGFAEEAVAAEGATAAFRAETAASIALSEALGVLAVAETEAGAAAARLAVLETEAAASTGFLTGATEALGTAMGFLGGPVGLLIIGLTALPLVLDSLGVSSGAAASRMDELQTALNKTKGEIDEYDNTITSVEQEIQRLTDKSADLTKNKAELGNEIVRLTGRFSGLSGEINGTETSIEGLISGMERLIVLQRTAKLGQQVAMGIQLDTQTNEAQSQNNALAAGYRGARGAFGINNKTSGILLSDKSQAAQQRAIDIITGKIIVEAAQLPVEVAKITDALGRSSGVVSDLAAFTANKSLIVKNNTATRKLLANDIDEGTLSTSRGYAKLEAQVPLQAKRYKTGEIGKDAYQNYLKDQVAFFDNELSKPYNADNEGRKTAILKLRTQVNDALQGLVAKDADDTAEALKGQKGKDKAARAGEAAKRKQDAAANKARSELYVNKESDSELKALESEARLPTTFGGLEALTSTYDKAAKDYVEGKMKQATDELAKKTGLTEADKTDFLAQALEDANNRVRQFRAKTSTSITKGLQQQLDASLKAIDDAFAVATQPGKLRLATLDGQIEGLNNTNVRNKVPDYTKAYLAKKRDQEAESQRPLEISAIDQKAAFYQSALPDLEIGSTSKDPVAKAEAIKELVDINDKLRALAVTRAQLVAQGDVSVIPSDLKMGATQAAASWRDQNDAALSFGETLTKNLGGAFDTVSSSGLKFFEDIADGSKSVLASFGGFVASMAKYLEELALKFAVTKLFDFALTSFGVTPASTGKNFNGGEIGAPIKRIRGGGVYREAPDGLVANGERGRDSVNTDLARGEFVMRSKAVDSVGVDFMSSLNKHGAGALAGLSQPVFAMPAPRPADPVNVYVVAPEEKPQMGPKDVLTTVHRDILDGGLTKKLIHSVNRGS